VELVLGFFETTEVQKGGNRSWSVPNLLKCLQSSLAQAPCCAVTAHAGQDIHSGQIDPGRGVVVPGPSKHTGGAHKQA